MTERINIQWKSRLRTCYGLVTDLSFMLWTCCGLATGKLVWWILGLIRYTWLPCQWLAGQT